MKRKLMLVSMCVWLANFAATASAHLPRACGPKQAPKVELACAKKNMLHSQLTIEWARAARRSVSFTTTQRLLLARIIQNHRWLYKQSQGDLAEATKRLNPRRSLRDYAGYCLARIIDREDNTWDPQRWNTAGSGAYGLPQALPASKMASAGADWATNPYTQIDWMRGYTRRMYGSECAALAFWESHGSY